MTQLKTAPIVEKGFIDMNFHDIRDLARQAPGCNQPDCHVCSCNRKTVADFDATILLVENFVIAARTLRNYVHKIVDCGEPSCSSCLNGGVALKSFDAALALLEGKADERPDTARQAD